MADDPRLQQAFDLIRAVVADAYARGGNDALRRIVETAQSTFSISALPVEQKQQPKGMLFKLGGETLERQRAPRGSVERVIARAFDRSQGEPVTVAQIMAAREAGDEMMIVDSSIRGELRRNNGTKYTQHGDSWGPKISTVMD